MRDILTERQRRITGLIGQKQKESRPSLSYREIAGRPGWKFSATFKGRIQDKVRALSVTYPLRRFKQHDENVESIGIKPKPNTFALLLVGGNNSSLVATFADPKGKSSVLAFPLPGNLCVKSPSSSF